MVAETCPRLQSHWQTVFKPLKINFLHGVLKRRQQLHRLVCHIEEFSSHADRARHVRLQKGFFRYLCAGLTILLSPLFKERLSLVQLYHVQNVHSFKDGRLLRGTLVCEGCIFVKCFELLKGNACYARK
ncbi:hypothetical protein GOP47_0025757 [Adiantum capillus-veneris]|nr:hypothetical protein GOP47_0025757 [Adiantum capillus-veneris]